MHLTQEEMDLLRARFETYGPDALRWELKDPGRRVILKPAMAEFAHDWLAEVDRESKRERRTKVMMAAAAVECVVCISYMLPI